MSVSGFCLQLFYLPFKKKARACLLFHSHVILLTKQNFSALPTSVSFRPASCFMVGCPERDDRLSSHINRVVQSANVLCTPLANPNTGGGISWGKNDCLLMLGQFCKLTGNILRQNIKKKTFPTSTLQRFIRYNFALYIQISETY